MHSKLEKPNSRRSRHLHWFAPAATFVLIVFTWRVCVAVFHVSPAILPPPENVAFAFARHFPALFRNAAVTFLEAILGFTVAAVFALTLAALFAFSASSKRALYPYAIAMKSIPLIALAPLVVAWFGGDLVSKVVLAAIISFFPILVSASDGFRAIDPDAFDLFRSFSASRRQIFLKLQFPAALPQIFAGLKTASSFAVVGAVVAEFIGAQAGIGLMIKSSSYYLDTDITFAAIIVAATVGLMFFGAVSFLQRMFVFWQPVISSAESGIDSAESMA